MIHRLMLFGATGDLAGRYLLPALTGLYAANKLPKGFRVVAAAREDWDDEAFRRHAAQMLDEHAAGTSVEVREALLRSLLYRKVDFNDPDSVGQVLHADLSDRVGGTSDVEPLAAYLALPANVFPPAVTALGTVGLPKGSRIALEKPFGEDLESAVSLNALLLHVVGAEGEKAIFRVDHALGLATVQNLMVVRLANRVLEPVWNGAHIEQIDILWDETLGLEGRANFYDRTGALKDVIQNHLLQIFCLVAMEPPVSLSEGDLRDRKLDVLRSIRPLTPADVAEKTRRARYTAGTIDGQPVPGYTEEEGIDPARGTETFAEVELQIDNWRWTGTRFRLRTGKALAKRRKEAIVRFKQVPALPFGDEEAVPPANELRIGLDGPWDFALSLTGRTTRPSPEGILSTHLAPLILDAELPAPELPAYSRVLMDILDGDSLLSIRGDEAEESWRVLTPVLKGWAENKVPLQEYPAGSAGPT